MSIYEFIEIFDVKGLFCLMFVVKICGVVDEFESGEILQVVVIDFGSMSDLKGWVDVIDGVVMFDQEEVEEDGDVVFCYFIQKE